MEVQIKDRKKDVEFLRTALSMCELNVDYKTTDLITRVYDMVKEKGGDASISDAIRLLYEWKEYWQDYFDKLKE